MHAVSIFDSREYFEYPVVQSEGAQTRIQRMLLDANTGDRKAAVSIVSRMISARRFGATDGAANVDGILDCLDELELLFALELSSIEEELLPAFHEAGDGAFVRGL